MTMTIYDALRELTPDENLVAILPSSSGTAFDVTAVDLTDEGILFGDRIGTTADKASGVTLAMTKMPDLGAVYRIINWGDGFVAFQQKQRLHICLIAYDGREDRHEITARNAQDAFDRLLRKISDSLQWSKGMPEEQRIIKVTVAVVLPLNPGQHPETPPLLDIVAKFVPHYRESIMWVRVPLDEDGDRRRECEAFAELAFNAATGENCRAQVMEVTEFATTGTILPVMR